MRTNGVQSGGELLPDGPPPRRTAAVSVRNLLGYGARLPEMNDNQVCNPIGYATAEGRRTLWPHDSGTTTSYA